MPAQREPTGISKWGHPGLEVRCLEYSSACSIDSGFRRKGNTTNLRQQHAKRDWLLLGRHHEWPFFRPPEARWKCTSNIHADSDDCFICTSSLRRSGADDAIALRSLDVCRTCLFCVSAHLLYRCAVCELALRYGKTSTAQSFQMSKTCADFAICGIQVAWWHNFGKQ